MAVLILFTSLRSLLLRRFHGRQAHVRGLVPEEHGAHQREAGADDARGGQDGPPVVVLQQHGGHERAQAAGQVHAAGQDRPIGTELGRLEPLDRRKPHMEREGVICCGHFLLLLWQLFVVAKKPDVIFILFCTTRFPKKKIASTSSKAIGIRQFFQLCVFIQSDLELFQIQGRGYYLFNYSH